MLESTTQLSAVNGMLATIGEAPINTLEGTSLVDVAAAKQALSEVTRSVLVEGWAFNTDLDYVLYPTGFDPFNITIPPNAMVVLPNDDYAHIIVRGSKLYDTLTHSDQFQGSNGVPCKVIWNMAFEELPEVTRQFIAIRAARLFQARSTASEILHAFSDADERMARWAHQRNNVRVRRKNFLIGNGTSASILAR